MGTPMANGADGSSNDNMRTPTRQNKQNAHTSVLGMDGTDLEASPPSVASNRTPPKRKNALLNGSMGVSSNSSHSNGNREDPVLSVGALPDSRSSWWGNVWGGSYNQVAPQHSNGRYSANDSLMRADDEFNNLNGGGVTTIEDQLRQDCHFFYQGFDDPPSPQQRRRFRSFSSPRDNSMRGNSREGSLFYAKYQRLNQDLTREKNGRHDLSLEEAGVSEPTHLRLSSETSINVLDVQHSCLFYEQDGKLLMKLPRDQMRLMMDHDLEPGIVSVQQWRKPEDQYQGLPAMSQMEMTPPLKYVLTVPDDLYRRVVSEMSYRLMPPCWGFFKCCHYHDDTDHADIRLALFILAVTFTLIFGFTIEWRTT